MVRALTMALVAALVAGCGFNPHFWQQAGRGQPDFERDSVGCAGEAESAPKDADMEKVYRACMRGKGWQRVKAATPMPDQFRGPESDEEMTSLPSPTSAPNEDDAAARCRLGNNWNQERLKALTEYHECLKRRR
jgi:hypothetical protein